MEFHDLKNCCESYLSGCLDGILQPEIQKCFIDTAAGLTVMRSLCIFGQAVELGKVKNHGKPVSLSELKSFFRRLPESGKGASASTSMTSEQNADVAKSTLKLLSEKEILAFFIDPNGKNLLANPSHWTIKLQHCFEKMMAAVVPTSIFPTRALVFGNLSMAASILSCSAWVGETVASVAVDDAGDNFGFALPVMKPSFQESERAVPSHGGALLFATLNQKEKCAMNMIQKDPLPAYLLDAFSVLIATVTGPIASQKTHLSSAFLTIAKKWDNAQMVMFETIKVLMGFLAKSSNPQLAAAAEIELLKGFSSDGTIFAEMFPYSYPDVARTYIRSNWNIRGTEGSHAFKILQDVINKGSNLGGVSEVMDLFSHPFTMEKGLVSFLIKTRDLATAAQEVAKPLPGTDGAPNPACSYPVALWSAMNRVHAASKDLHFRMNHDEKKFVDKMIKNYHSGTIPDFSAAISLAQKGLMSGLLEGRRKFQQPRSEPVAYGASGGSGGSGCQFGSGNTAHGGGKRGGSSRGVVSIDDYKKAVGTLLEQIKNAPSPDNDRLKFLVPISFPELGEFNFRLKRSHLDGHKHVFIPESVVGKQLWSVTILRKAIDQTSPSFNEGIASASILSALVAEARVSSKAAKKASKKERAANSAAHVQDQSTAPVVLPKPKPKSRSPSPISTSSVVLATRNAREKALEAEVAAARKETEDLRKEFLQKEVESRLSRVESAVLHSSSI